MRKHSRSVLVLVLGCLFAGPASAISMGVLSSQVFVDVYAQAETVVRDPAPSSASSLDSLSAVANFVGSAGLAASASANAISQRPPLGDSPPFVLGLVNLSSAAATGPNGQTQSRATSSGGGSLLLEIRGAPSAAEPAAALSFNISLGAPSGPGYSWAASYLVFNETTGTSLFSAGASSAGGSLPAAFVVPVGFGDAIRVTWSMDLSSEAANGAIRTGLASFNSRVSPLAVPEPATAIVLLAGLAALAAAARRGAAAAS